MTCAHLQSAADREPPATLECVDCVAAGHRDWVHLRMCLSCGHIGCCDSSPGKHASAHYAETHHPVIQSVEPGETWHWCFVDETISA
jgi:uncharacterized UBP type Zn finger protein